MSRSLTGSEIAQPAYQSVVNEGALEVNNMLAFLKRAEGTSDGLGSA